jgi:two-component sensor histidine kinase
MVVLPDGLIPCATLPVLRGTVQPDLLSLQLGRENPDGASSWILMGTVTHQPLVALIHAFSRDGAFAGIVSAGVRVQRLIEAIGPATSPDALTSWLADSRGAVFRVGGPEADLPAGIRAPVNAPQSAPIVADGRRFVAAQVDANLSVIGELPPQSVVMAVADAVLQVVVLLVGIGLLGAGLVAWLVRRGVRLPLRRLGRALSEGATRTDDPALAAAPDEIRELAEAVFGREATLRRDLGLRDLLLREVNHRVRNNLQMVASIIRLHGRQVTEPHAQATLRAAEDRIHALALVHNQLTAARKAGGVDLTRLVWRLAETMVSSAQDSAERLHLDVSGDEVWVDTDAAVAVGLIVNDWILRAVRQRFPAPATGRIWLRIHREDDGAVVEYADDGPPEMPRDPTEPGRALMRALAGQVGGVLEEQGSGGTLRRRLSLKLPAEAALSPD